MTAAGTARSGGRALLTQLRSRDPLDVVPRVTLLLLIPRAIPLDAWQGLWLFAALAVALFPVLYRSPWLWLAVAGVRAWTQLEFWAPVDNHEWLITYWCLALACAFGSSRPRVVMAVAGTAMIALTFVFATMWKLISGEFLDSRSFHFELLFEWRFENPTRWIGGLSEADYEANRSSLRELRSSGSDLERIALVSTSRLRALAWLLAIGTVVMEAAIALTFLASRHVRGVPMTRLLLLLAFCATTYLFAPIVKFGIVLLVMGYAQTDEDFSPRGWFLVGIAALLVWPPVWLALHHLG